MCPSILNFNPPPHIQDVDFAWPDVSDVMAFRDAVKDAVEKAILTSMPEPAVTPVTPESLWWSLFMAFEHDHIHLETSSVLIRQVRWAVAVCFPS